jgi:UPF0755 protein
VSAAVLGGLFFWNEISLPVSANEEKIFFTVSQGQGVKEIAQALKEKGIIRSEFWFETYVFFDGSSAKFLAGNYYLQPSMNIKEVAEEMTRGHFAPEQSITIIEGWTAGDIAEYLADKSIVAKNDFITAANVVDSRAIIPDKTYDFLAGRPTDQGLEGFLFPDTYRVFEKTMAAEIIEKMLDNFSVKYTEQMRQDTAKGNMTIYQIVTLASVIEKEVRTDTDRKIAAGIFYDRLNLGVPLQSDATVNYVTGKNSLQPTNDDISVDSLYNTYKYRGLPPGPICNPSLSSIMAAIYPEKSDYFYFLTRPDGSTVFSKTYEEHLANKRKYLQ